MAIVLPDTSGLGQGLGALAQGLGTVAGQRRRQKQQQGYAGVLGEVLGGITAESSPMDVIKAFLQATERGVPMDVATSYASNLSNLMKAERPRMRVTGDQIERLKETFQAANIPEELADQYANLYAVSSIGGQTQLMGALGDIIARQDRNMAPPEMQSIEQEEALGVQRPDTSNLFKGMTPKEKAKFQGDLYKDNVKQYNELRNELKSKQNERIRLKRLSTLNNSGKLPSGVGRVLIKKDGSLKFPFAHTKETQEFVKLINDFTTQAKDSYGARVTNFELDRFMQRLPSLLNSSEGRSVILKKMDAINNINTLHANSLKKAYDEYGLRNTDLQTAEKYAEQLRNQSGDEDSLIEEYVDADEFIKRSGADSNDDEMIMIEINGKRGRIPASNLDEALKRGAKRL